MQEIECLQDGTPLDKEQLQDNGVVSCPNCGQRFITGEKEALTYLEDLPLSEYLGG